MPPYAPEPESSGRKRDLFVAGVVLVLAFSAMFLSGGSQQQIAGVFQTAFLRPFTEVQLRREVARLRGVAVEDMRSLVDSLTLMLSTHAAVVDENETLRELLVLGERAGAQYRPATVLRPGTPGSESMFLVDVGAEDGLRQGSAVVGPAGLIGVIREVRPRQAVGMDWTHPDFRVGAMIEDGSAYGLVERWEGEFREADRLVLNGIAFNQSVARSSRVVTSGAGGIFPRGIPIGRTQEVFDTEGSWRKSYWLDPFVDPGSTTHVLVLTRDVDLDATRIWPGDSIAAADTASVSGGLHE